MGKGRTVHLEEEKDSPSRKVLLGELPKVPQTSTPADKDISISQDPKKTLQDELTQQNKNTIATATILLQEYHDNAHKQAVVQWNLKKKGEKTTGIRFTAIPSDRSIRKKPYQSGGRTGENVHQ